MRANPTSTSKGNSGKSSDKQSVSRIRKSLKEQKKKSPSKGWA